MSTQTVDQVFMDEFSKVLDERAERRTAYLVKGSWSTVEEGKAHVAVLEELRQVKMEFEDIHKRCFGY